MIKRKGGSQIGLFDPNHKALEKQRSNEVQLGLVIHRWKDILKRI